MSVLLRTVIKAAVFATCLMVVGCAPTEEVWTGRDKNPIEVVCGPECSTIDFARGSDTLSRRQKAKIDRFVARHGRDSVFVSPCATGPINHERIAAVRAQIAIDHRKSILLKKTLPANLHTLNCVNLVSGKLYMYVQNCPNRYIPPSVQTIGSDFGCSTNYALAHMIINPWNLLATSGDNGTEGDRVAIGEKNYREGVVSKLDMESSS